MFSIRSRSAEKRLSQSESPSANASKVNGGSRVVDFASTSFLTLLTLSSLRRSNTRATNDAMRRKLVIATPMDDRKHHNDSDERLGMQRSLQRSFLIQIKLKYLKIVLNDLLKKTRRHHKDI